VSSEPPLARIVRELDARTIPHMVAGSLASTYHGEPRATQDIDLVIDPSREALLRFASELDPERFYVSREAASEAWARRGLFNVVDLSSGWKIDLILRKDRPFSREEFARRMPATIFETAVFVASAEDTILSKLEWARSGESERQLRDVLGVVEVSGGSLDRGYVERWADALGVRDLWEHVVAEAEAGPSRAQEP
jgi:hypothetical protein